MEYEHSDCIYETEQHDNYITSNDAQPSTSSCGSNFKVDLDCFEESELSFVEDNQWTDTICELNGVSSSAENLNEILKGIDHFLSSSCNSPDKIADVQAKKIINTADKTRRERPLENNRKRRVLKKGQRYLPGFKRKVLNYAVKHTFKETAKKFKINCNTLTEWAREYKRLLLLKKSTSTRPGSYKKTEETISVEKTDLEKQDLSSDLASDVKFLHWLRKKRIEGCRIGREEIHSKGLACLNSATNCPSWFTSWIHRIAELKGGKSVEKNARKADKYIIYPVNFKLEVALYAKVYTKTETAKAFGVSSRRLYDWCERLDGHDHHAIAVPPRQQVEHQLLGWYHQIRASGARPNSFEIMEKARSLYAANGLAKVKCSQGWLDKIRKRLGLKLLHSDDEELLVWILSQLDNNVSLTVLQVTAKACELASRKHVTNFKGSKGWTLRFLKRHSHLLQCSSVMLSELPNTAAAQAKSFCLAVQQRVGAASLPLHSIGCMDEIPITFVYPTEKVPTPPLLRKAGLEAAHAIVILAATSDGHLLPPAVVLKGKRTIQNYFLDNISIPVMYNETGGVNAENVRRWLRNVWFRHVAAPSILVVDSFAPHLDKKLSQQLSAGCCHMAVIPPGCAVHLQPCGFNLSRRFQEYVQDEWLKFATFNNSIACRTKTGPDEEVILNWVVKAYRTLREDTYSIRSSFHLTGLIQPTPAGELNLPINLSSNVHNKD